MSPGPLILTLLLAGGLVTWEVVVRAETPGATQVSSAPSAGMRIDKVEIGFQGAYKVGCWTPVRVSLTPAQAGDYTFVVETPDPDEDFTTLPSRPLHFAAGETRLHEAYFKTGRMHGDVVLSVLDSGGQTLASQKLRAGTDSDAILRPARALDVPLRVTLGHPVGFDGKVAGSASNPDGNSEGASSAVAEAPESANGEIIHLRSPAQLPFAARGYEGVNTLIISVATPELLGEMDAVQTQAVCDWVRLGGHLLVSLGENVAAYQSSELGKTLQSVVEITGRQTLRQVNSLEAYCGLNIPVAFPGTIPGAKIGNFEGSMLVQEIDGPLVVRAPFGFGRVTLLGVDIDRPPLSTWRGLPAVCSRLLGTTVTGVQSQSRPQGQLAQVGVTDLASQLVATLDEFAGVHRFTYWTVMGWIVIYLVIIGPLDYLLVTKVFRRPELTWVTFPLLVCLGAIVSVLSANALNGKEMRLNQLELVDIDASRKLLRGHAWLALYSPENRRYAVAVAPDGGKEAAESVDISWMGIPENTVGGLYRPGGVSFSGRGYAYTPDAKSLENLPIQKWSTKSLESAWHDEAGELVTSSLESEGVGRLSGSVAHHLKEAMQGCMLVYGGRVYFPRGGVGNLSPHQEWEPAGPAGMQRELRGYLTGTVAERKESKNSKFASEIVFKTEPYNPLAHNPEDLARILSFHQAAGGHGYTGLNHAALGQLDFAPLLQLGRAVLMGQVKKPAATVNVDGQPLAPSATTTFYRFVLPVKQVKGEEVFQLPKAGDPEATPK